MLATLLAEPAAPEAPAATAEAAPEVKPEETPKVDARLEELTAEPRSAAPEAEVEKPAAPKADLSQANAKLNDLLGGKRP